MSNDKHPLTPATAQPRGRLWARWGLDPALGLIDGVYIEWDGGAFTRVEPSPRPPRDCPAAACFPGHLLTPGLLNAHAHLDYAFLRGALPRGAGFVPWLRAMIQTRRALKPEEAPARRDACLGALEELARGGATEVWDVSSFGWAREALLGSPLRAFSFEEWIAPRRSTWEPAWSAWWARFNLDCGPLDAATDGRLSAGISAHAPYSVCPPALGAAAHFAQRHRLPLALHLAESPEENAMLLEGRGALLELLGEISGGDPLADLGRDGSPLQRAHAAGALTPATLAIHCNLPQPEEAHLLAASGAAVVFCPRSHAFFGYPPYPLESYHRRGVRLALGTDSLASNDSLDMREEVREFVRLTARNGWNPLEVLAVATGAALGERPPFGGRGKLEPWKPAQWALWQLAEGAGMGEPNPGRMMEEWLEPATRLARSSALSEV